jgi:uridine kinase
VRDVVIVEGVSAARVEAAPDLALAIFVTADRELRLARGVERDGEALRGEWLRWMEREAAHFSRDRTIERADLLVDGAPDVPHDPAREFVLKGG